MQAKSLVMTVRGQKRRVSILKQNADGSFAARIREPGTYSSIRGTVRANKLGVMVFKPSNPERL